MATLSGASAIIDLFALRGNFKLLAEKAGPAYTAAVVKANAYGLGAIAVAQALEAVGCYYFFVASIEEGIQLRFTLNREFIGVFYGTNNYADADAVYTHGLIPVLNSMDQITVWQSYARQRGQNLPAIVHVDTGMTRVGISLSEAQKLAENPELLTNINVQYFMSHLACAEATNHPLNAKQLARFNQLRKWFPESRFSLANSSGIFLSTDYHGDMVRPGMAIYGLNPTPDDENPMRPVVTLQAPILQVRVLEEEEHVGYGATYKAAKGSRLATAAIGYADGLVRSLSNRGEAHINGFKVPIAGIVSMDLTVLDISNMPENAIVPGATAEFFGKNLAADDVAEKAGTIGYELFTSITSRVKRVYL